MSPDKTRSTSTTIAVAPAQTPTATATSSKAQPAPAGLSDGFEIHSPSRFRGAETPKLMFIAHEVKPGDTLAKIAEQYTGSAAGWEALAQQNPQLNDPKLVFPGNLVFVAVGTAAPEAAAATEVVPASDASVAAQAEAEVALLKAQLEAAADYRDLNAGGILAVMAPGGFTEDLLQAIHDWIEGKDPVTGEKDNPGWQLLKVLPGAPAMGVAVIYGGLLDFGATVGQIGKRATGTDPDGSRLQGAELEATKAQLQRTQAFADGQSAQRR